MQLIALHVYSSVALHVHSSEELETGTRKKWRCEIGNLIEALVLPRMCWFMHPPSSPDGWYRTIFILWTHLWGVGCNCIIVYAHSYSNVWLMWQSLPGFLLTSWLSLTSGLKMESMNLLGIWS